MMEYKGYLVLGRAGNPGSPDWRSQGIVLTNTPQGSIMIQRLEGAVFKSKKAAEAHGLEPINYRAVHGYDGSCWP